MRRGASSPDPSFTNVTTALWSLAELETAILTTSLPVLRPIIARFIRGVAPADAADNQLRAGPALRPEKPEKPRRHAMGESLLYETPGNTGLTGSTLYSLGQSLLRTLRSRTDHEETGRSDEEAAQPESRLPPPPPPPPLNERSLTKPAMRVAQHYVMRTDDKPEEGMEAKPVLAMFSHPQKTLRPNGDGDGRAPLSDFSTQRATHMPIKAKEEEHEKPPNSPATPDTPYSPNNIDSRDFPSPVLPHNDAARGDEPSLMGPTLARPTQADGHRAPEILPTYRAFPLPPRRFPFAAAEVTSSLSSATTSSDEDEKTEGRQTSSPTPPIQQAQAVAVRARNSVRRTDSYERESRVWVTRSTQTVVTWEPCVDPFEAASPMVESALSSPVVDTRASAVLGQPRNGTLMANHRVSASHGSWSRETVTGRDLTSGRRPQPDIESRSQTQQRVPARQDRASANYDQEETLPRLGPSFEEQNQERRRRHGQAVPVQVPRSHPSLHTSWLRLSTDSGLRRAV